MFLIVCASSLRKTSSSDEEGAELSEPWPNDTAAETIRKTNIAVETTTRFRQVIDGDLGTARTAELLLLADPRTAI